jgi:hypothetical protein
MVEASRQFAFLFFAAILPSPATHRSTPCAAGTALAAAIGAGVALRCAWG